jgi:putative flavoprotein involved in K+ transport
MQKIETVIIGGGQAGLATSYCLGQFGRENIVLEKSDIPGSVWRDDRWDSFTLNTPNSMLRMPGAVYDGPDPDGFLSRTELLRYFDGYAARYHLPVQYNTRVESVEQDARGYRVRAGDQEYAAWNVVVATGLYQTPKIPGYAAQIAPEIQQLASGRYRRESLLPPGAVLVVGAGQSGMQIAEELYQSGRKVYLSVGRAPRVPRRYRGKDAFEWNVITGIFSRPPEALETPAARFWANPQISGKDGGHSLNLHQFYRDGVSLLGRLSGAEGACIRLNGDLQENIAAADQFEARFLRRIDEEIALRGLPNPPESVPVLTDAYAAPDLRELDLAAAGVTSIIWATGYDFDFSLVKLPVFDEAGFPVQHMNETAYHGLFFVGMPYLTSQKSGLLLGVGDDAQDIARRIAAG